MHHYILAERCVRASAYNVLGVSRAPDAQRVGRSSGGVFDIFWPFKKHCISSKKKKKDHRNRQQVFFLPLSAVRGCEGFWFSLPQGALLFTRRKADTRRATYQTTSGKSQVEGGGRKNAINHHQHHHYHYHHHHTLVVPNAAFFFFSYKSNTAIVPNRTPCSLKTPCWDARGGKKSER